MLAAPEPMLRRVRTALGVAAAALLPILVIGEDPWRSGVFERAERDGYVRLRDAATFAWVAALGNLALLGILFVTARLWLRPGGSHAPSVSAAPPAPHRVARFSLVALAMVVLLLQAWPRMDHSLWTDEEYSARRSVVGSYEVDSDGRVAWEPLGWSDTLWAYRQPNNHVPFSILSRISTRVAGTERPEEGMEVAFRLPALVFGLAGLAAMAALGTRIGAPWAGVLAAWILAAHPWYLRFASGGRGYSLVLCLLPLFWVAAWRVLERPSWRRFAVFGAAQFLLMWAYPALFVLVGLTNLWMLAEAVRGRAQDGFRSAFLARLVVTGTCGAMLFLQLMLPNVVQLQAYLERKLPNFSPRWFENLGSLLLAGTRFGSHEADPLHPTVSDLAHASPGLFGIAVGLFAIVAGAGFVRLVLRGGPHARFAVLLVAAAPLTIAWAWATDTLLYPWYLAFSLTGLALFVALGIGWAYELRPGGGTRAFGAALAVAVGCLIVFVGQPSRRALIDRPIDPYREAVLATRETLDPTDERQDRVITTGLGGCDAFYDPLCREVRSLDDLRTLIREADAQGKLLFVSYGRVKLLERRVPDQLAFVRRDDLFETAATFEGYDSYRRRVVRRYRPGSFDPDLPGAPARARPAGAQGARTWSMDPGPRISARGARITPRAAPRAAGGAGPGPRA